MMLFFSNVCVCVWFFCYFLCADSNVTFKTETTCQQIAYNNLKIKRKTNTQPYEHNVAMPSVFELCVRTHFFSSLILFLSFSFFFLHFLDDDLSCKVKWYLSQTQDTIKYKHTKIHTRLAICKCMKKKKGFVLRHNFRLINRRRFYVTFNYLWLLQTDW